MVRIGSALVLLGALSLPCIATEFFVSPQGSHETPFATWATAATNIQDAIDVAAASDVVWVTNGVYSEGGRTMGSVLTNRVVLDKALTLQSVNGPEFTTIMGAWDTETNGMAAVRCAWLTNGAVLKGFTLFRGGTAPFWFTATNLSLGGGVWGASTNAVVENCVITTNSASMGGAGAFQVSLIDCTLIGNRILLSSPRSSLATLICGGGAFLCHVRNCQLIANQVTGNGAAVSDSFVENTAIIGNFSERWAGGAYRSVLRNCTVVGNRTGSDSVVYGAGAVRDCSLINCVAYSNTAYYLYETNANFTTSLLTYSCSNPLPPGEGNVNSDPHLLPDSIHLAETSPCRGAGTNITPGTDIDGQAWGSVPSMGCDEWDPTPIFIGKMRKEPFGIPVSLRLVGLQLAGQGPWGFTWTRDGQVIEESIKFGSVTNDTLRINSLMPEDSGKYELTASNQFGVSRSLLEFMVRCVNVDNPTPLPPYSTWSAAATNIQDAIDFAKATDVVLVTNGVYFTGGRLAVAGDITNRIVVDKPIMVTSVNGYKDTIIEGSWDPHTTNGPLAVRGAYLVNGATLNGFTVRGGATGDKFPSDWRSVDGVVGGGVWGQSSNAFLLNSWLYGNAAQLSGGGCASLSARNCILEGNYASSQGGAYDCRLTNCLVIRNFRGGVVGGTLVNSTVVRNFGIGADALYEARNSIIYSNYSIGYDKPFDYAMAPLAASYNCTTRVSSFGGTNNIETDPQLLGDYRLAVTSPCRGTGNAAFVSGTDLDGQPWANPPSMGCSEVWESERIGPLSVGLSASLPEVAQGGSIKLLGSLTGNATRVDWDFGDGLTLTNESRMEPMHSWTNPGDFTVTFRAYNTEQVNGVSTNLVVNVIPLEATVLTSSGLVGANFGLSFSTQPGVTYTVQRATNFEPPVIWQTLHSIYSTGAYIYPFTDTKATNDSSYYRVHIP
jgi:hypothetical protein